MSPFGVGLRGSSTGRQLSGLSLSFSLISPLQSWSGFILIMPTEKTWQPWLERFCNLRRDKCGSHEQPHKRVLLLTILDLLDRRWLSESIEMWSSLTRTV